MPVPKFRVTSERSKKLVDQNGMDIAVLHWYGTDVEPASLWVGEVARLSPAHITALREFLSKYSVWQEG